MRMKLFSGATMDEAMAAMRAELGPDAVVLSTCDEPGCIEVRAAVERPIHSRFAAPLFSEARPTFDMATRNRLEDVLAWHGAPEGFSEIVVNAGMKLMGDSADAGPALSAGIEGVLSFAPVHADTRKAVLLVGPPGGGKTSAAARLERTTQGEDKRFRAISADFDACGGHARLAAYVERADVALFKTPEALQRRLLEENNNQTKLVIDGPSINPVSPADISRLRNLLYNLDVEPVLVMSAEGHPADLEDNARAFKSVGVKRVILTKLDGVRRRGGAFAAISSSRLSIAQLSLTQIISGGLIPATPLRIARLLLETAPESGSGSNMSLKGAA